MRFIGADGGRMVALFLAEEIRGTTGWHPGQFIQEIRERYRFEYVPDLADLKGDVSVLVFKHGCLEKDGESFGIRELGFYPAGVVIDALETDFAEAFFKDLFAWGQGRFGWSEPTSLRLRFFSSVVVEFEREIESMLGRLQSMCSIFSAAIREDYQLAHPFKLKSLVLSSDPMDLPSSAVSPDVTIQRRADFPYVGNRYYCIGPFRTSRFKELLQRAEAILLSNE
jgi:hypothetical protein